MSKAHKNRTEDFEELDYAGQASSINASINNLEAAIKANIRRAEKEGRESPKDKRLVNLQDMLDRLKNS